MLEALVAGLCIADQGCSPALKAYYAEKPAIKMALNKTKTRIVAATGEWVTIVPTAAALISGQRFTFKVYKNTSLVGESNSVLLLWSKSY